MTVNWIRAVADWWKGIQRAELRIVPYRDADALLEQGWRIAAEEDHNRVIGLVYLERMGKR